jgi:hypothetical protein
MSLVRTGRTRSNKQAALLAVSCCALLAALLVAFAPIQSRDVPINISTGNEAALIPGGAQTFVRAAMSVVPTDTQDGTEVDHPYCLRRSEAPIAPEGSASDDVSFSLPKRHPGREAGSQSPGSLGDGQVTEEAPSADPPNTLLKDGGEAVCKGF